MDSSMQIKWLIDIAWRRKWWIVAPTVVAAIVSLVAVAMVPRVYRATTTILVSRQSVPEDMVRSTVTLRIEEQMRRLQVQLFSRSYLEQIAREFEMIPADAQEFEIERACVALREQIVPEVDKAALSWFRISVENVDPKRAAGIANRLAVLFIEQNSRMRASQAAGTLATTEGWEERYRLELQKRDKDVAEFKQQHIYEMPDQQPANLHLLNIAQSRVMQLTGDIQSRNDRLVALRSQQQAQRALYAATGVPDPAAGEGDDLAALHRELLALLSSYTEEHPAVKRKRTQIAELAQTLQGDRSGGSGASVATVRLDPASMQIVAIENEIRALERERARENANIEAFRGRIASAPQRQQRLLELTRDYESVKQQFDTAVAQKEQAQRSQDLEESKKGEQFQIQDRAYPPALPFKPNFIAFVLAGIGLGLALGIGATAAREFVDQTVGNEEEFSAVFPDLPVYAVIPSLDVDLEPRSRPRPSVREVGLRTASILLPLVAAIAAGVTAVIGRRV